jgi:hypothetical protein
MRRLFTLEEARAMLPRVGALMREMRERKAEFDRHRAAYELIAPRAADGAAHLRAALTRHHAAIERLALEIEGLMNEVQELGAEIKGIDEGLIDFPADRDGETIYLCWKLDEPDIAWWHDLTSGFQGRRPLHEGP